MKGFKNQFIKEHEKDTKRPEVGKVSGSDKEYSKKLESALGSLPLVLLQYIYVI